MYESADKLALSLDTLLVTMDNPQMAVEWLSAVRDQAATVRKDQALLAVQLDKLDRMLLVASEYAPISDLAIETKLSRPTIYKAIERARTKATATQQYTPDQIPGQISIEEES